MAAFPQNIAPNGTFALHNEVRDKKKRRYFTKNEEHITLNDGTCYVVSGEWGGDRHKRFVKVARDLGYAIKEVT